ncbi:hypothetical protein FBR02_01750 [Anaerolineae bacterium CFX9]|nr:hypothetical protein [Anaerolineae bacterium CFX9]
MKRMKQASINACLRLIAIALLSAAIFGVQAQDNAAGSGQFWVRLFEDRNGNGVKDTNEPLLTRGAAVTLANSAGVIIASALLDESPNAAQGLIGFQFLQPGTYTITVTAPEYEATTDASFTRQIVSGAIPTVVEFGADRIDPAALQAGSGAAGEPQGILGLPIQVENREEIGRIAISLFGALIVIGVMWLLGFLIYTLILRPRYRRQMAQVGAYTTTGSMRAVNLPDDYAFRPPTSTGTGSQPAVRDTGEQWRR